jgi:hypothetical protein
MAGDGSTFETKQYPHTFKKGLSKEKAVNTFSTRSYATRFKLGLSRDKKKIKLFKETLPHKLILPMHAAVIIPGKLDLTPKVSPPEDQGQCGACWDFSITKALRSAWMLVGKDPGRLAFNYLLNNCGGVVDESGCGGGDFPAAQNDLTPLGPWLEAQDPYTGGQGNCMQGLSVAATAASWVLVGDGGAPPTFQELSYAISQNHMLSVDVAVCGAWESYASGIFNQNDCGPDSINHMINMVGYDCETSLDKSGHCVFDANGQPVNGDGFLIAMNNWGTSWGEAGYMRSRWHIDALADTAMFFTVAATPPTPPVPPTPPIPPVPPVPPTPVHVPMWYGFLCGPIVHFMSWCVWK